MPRFLKSDVYNGMIFMYSRSLGWGGLNPCVRWGNTSSGCNSSLFYRIMSTAKYSRIANDTRPGGLRRKSNAKHSPQISRWQAFLVCCALSLTVYFVVSSLSDRTIYNPLPSTDDKSFNSTSLPVVIWHGMGTTSRQSLSSHTSHTHLHISCICRASALCRNSSV